MQSLNDQIKRLRSEANLTQADLAKMAKIKQQDVSEFETGYRTPSYRILKRIADALGVEVVLAPKKLLNRSKKAKAETV